MAEDKWSFFGPALSRPADMQAVREHSEALGECFDRLVELAGNSEVGSKRWHKVMVESRRHARVIESLLREAPREHNKMVVSGELFEQEV